MKIRIIIFFLFFALINLTNCKKKNTLLVTPSYQEVVNQSGRFVVTISSNTVWNVNSNAEWCSVSRTDGNKNSSITISYNANKTATQRTATLTFKASDVDDFIVIINQEAGVAQTYLKEKEYFDAEGKNLNTDTFVYSDIFITSVISSNNERYVYDYNNDNLPIKRSFYNAENILEKYTEFEYNNSNLMEKSTYYFTKKDISNGSWETFEYNTNNQLIKSSFYNENGNLLYYSNFSSLDKNIENILTFVITNKGEYKYYEKNIIYDDAKVALLNTSLAKIYPYSKAKNNIIKIEETFFNEDGTTINIKVKTYHFEYNDNNFPIKQINDDNSFILLKYVDKVR